MKVLHVPYTYYPHACGGTEVYVASLCKFLDEAGVHTAVAAPADATSNYEHDGKRVHRFATHQALTQDMMYGEGDPVAAAGFARILDMETPDLVHFHALTPAIGVLCLREAQRRSIPALTTYHTPTNSCLRGTLMRWGTTPCDGEIRPVRCASCLLHSHGMPRPLAVFSALASLFTYPLARWSRLPNGARAVVGSAALVEKRKTAVKEWWAGMKRVIALCDWTRHVLLVNVVPAERIALIRHGLPFPSPSSHTAQLIAPPLKLVFFGRADPTKGIDLLLNAMRLAAGLDVTLDLYLIGYDTDKRPFIDLVQDDNRIAIKPPVPASQVEATLLSYHALLVPSRWLETGPLVVLEAFAAGIPVIGSNLGGIAEKVRHEVDGLLVEAPTPDAWRATLQRLVDDPLLLPRLKAGVKAPRTMREVAAETQSLYLEVLENPHPPLRVDDHDCVTLP